MSCGAIPQHTVTGVPNKAGGKEKEITRVNNCHFCSKNRFKKKKLEMQEIFKAARVCEMTQQVKALVTKTNVLSLVTETRMAEEN